LAALGAGGGTFDTNGNNVTLGEAPGMVRRCARDDSEACTSQL
jgi:hypothetical protein